jgi:hypothetical protein
MMRRRHFEHRFVQNIPEKLEPGILYISMEYATAAHSCFCGCGEEVVTPFSPTDWKLVFDGETVSLWPSVGSWTLRCRSHYVLDRGRIVEAGDWSEAAVAAERRRDKAAKESYYGEARREGAPEPAPAAPPAAKPREGIWARARRFFAQLLRRSD